MATCPKCHTVNEEGLTRCRSCKAILPVKIGSKSEVRYERVRRQAELVGMKCPACGATNTYTQFRCRECGASLSRPEPKGGLAKLWMALALALAVAVVALAFVLRKG